MSRWPKRSWLDDSIIQTVNNVLNFYKEQGQDLPSGGVFEQKYCESFSKFQGSGFSHALNSGTSAVYVALKSVANNKGEHVICSPVTDFGSVSALILNHFKILIPDATQNSFNLSLAEIKKVYSDKVQGILLTHSAGEVVPQMGEIQAFCKQKNIWLIEDCSQAHGAQTEGQKVGNFSDLAIFSTMHSKAHSTGGAGGLVFTQERGLFNRVRSYSDRGKKFELSDFDSKNPDHILAPSLNFSGGEIASAIGHTNLLRLTEMIATRVSFLEKLRQSLKNEDLPFEIAMNLKGSSPYFCPILIKTNDPQATKTKLVELGLPCNPHYSFLVSEWTWAKEHFAETPNNQNVRSFRNKSINLHFNENFGQKQLEDIIGIFKQVSSK